MSNQNVQVDLVQQQLVARLRSARRQILAPQPSSCNECLSVSERDRSREVDMSLD